MFDRRLMLVPALAVLALGGCKMRGDNGAPMATQESGAENQRLRSELDNEREENAKLAHDLDAARDQLSRNQNGSGDTVKNLLAGGEIAGVTQTENGGVALDEDFSFAKGSAELSDDGKKAVTALAERLNKGEFTSSKVVVEGHTDDTPVSRASTKDKYVDNWGLSAARAASVVRALQAAGVDPLRLHGAFRGEYAPRTDVAKTDAGETGEKSDKASKGDKADKARNRRVELYLR